MLLAFFCTMSIGWAQQVTEQSQLSNDKVYTITSARAFLLYSEKASSLKDADKEKKDTFRKELQELFKKKDLESKTAIKANLIKIEEDHKKALQEFKDLKENSLKKAEEDYLKIQTPTKKDQRDYSDIRKGIEINCKRSMRKENSSYESLVTNTKLLRKEIHDEYLKILSLAGTKESPVDRLKNKQLEYYGTVNLKASLLSKKFQSIKAFAFVFRKINNLTWSCLTELASVVSSLLTKNIN